VSDFELIFVGCWCAAACAGSQPNAARSLVKPVTIGVAHRQVWSTRRRGRREPRVTWAATCSTQ